MTKFRVLLTAVAAAFAMQSAAVAAPLEAYGRLPTIEDVAISPEGGKLAIIVTNGEERGILVRDLVAGSSKTMGVGPAKVRSVQWAGPEHVLITTSQTHNIDMVTGPKSEYFMLVDYNVTTGKLRPLLGDFESGLNVVLGSPMIRTVNGKVRVFVEAVRFVNHIGRVALGEIDLETGKSELVNPGFPETSDWVVGPAGELIAQSTYDPKKADWKLLMRRDGGWPVAHTAHSELEYPTLAGLGRDGASALVIEPVDGEFAYREVKADGVWPEPFRVGADMGLLFDPRTYALIGFQGLEGDKRVYEFFRPADQAAWAKVERAYRGGLVRLYDWSEDRTRIVVSIDLPKEGPGFALVDFKAGRVDPIGWLYPGVPPADIAEVRPFAFKAKDGLDLSGYLTLPPGRPDKGAPLIVLAHGGPESRDTLGFDWWAQALASRGYAVAQINFRGSSGFGEEFVKAGHGEWGRKMQTDLSDGVRYLAAQGAIDPSRVCIVGASYGGYAALAGLAFDPGVYRCAVSVAGVSDLTNMIAHAKRNKREVATRYWSRFIGAEDPKDPVLAQYSPITHAAEFAGPVLLIHGKDDTVVPWFQSISMEKALKDAGKPVEFIAMAGEDHWLSRGATRQQMLQATVAFLEKHNPPK